MDYELAKELKDAGFPQKQSPWFPVPGTNGKERIYCPTLSELIEACGSGAFMLLTKGDGVWAAALNGKGADGGTPEIATAKLYLALHAK